MRILLLSDISWRQTGLDIIKKRVQDINPALVLLAGDLVNDRSVEGWASLYELIGFLDRNKIQTFFIRGNWDECAQYDELVEMTKGLPCTEEISGRIVEFRNLKILGLPFSFTRNLKVVRQVEQAFPGPIDIVLAHAELIRRIWLFKLKTKFIVTGHFDSQLCQIRDKVFISLQSFPPNYAIIDYGDSQQAITYFREGLIRGRSFLQDSKSDVSKAKVVNGQFVSNTNPLKRLFFPVKKADYAMLVERLISAKEQLEKGVGDRDEIVAKLLQAGIPKKHIQEYLSFVCWPDN